MFGRLGDLHPYCCAHDTMDTNDSLSGLRVLGGESAARLRDVRYRIDLDAQLFAGERRDTDRGARGTMRAEHPRVDAVHLLELAHVDEKHAAAEHVLQARTCCFENRLDVLQ